jgi:lysophospholipase L1-like esterase
MRRIFTRISVYLNVALLALLLSVVFQTGLASSWLAGWNLPATGSAVMAAIAQQPRPDTLATMPWWQDENRYRVNITASHHYEYCLFGDSITSLLGNTLGSSTFNFALSGMSSVSLVEQLNQLLAAKVKCSKVIIAMGTNDADYRITNQQFVNNMERAIVLTRQMQAYHIVLLPAFYSTVAASHNIDMAGPLSRVKEINRLLQQVAANQGVMLTGDGLDPLYSGEALRDDMTTDGVHLNARGRVIYRNALLRIMENS